MKLNELIVFSFYRWSILKFIILCYNQTFIFLFFQPNYFEIDPLDCSLNAQSGCVMVSFGLSIECPKWLRYGFLWTVYKKNEWTKVEWNVSVLFLQMIYFEIYNFMLQPNFYFYFSKQTILKLILCDHKDCPLDCSLDCPLDCSLKAQSGCVMVSFGLFIKRMIELKLNE